MLPLNVPAEKPLLYCNGIEIAQIPVQLGNEIYSCGNLTVEVSCSTPPREQGECFSGTVECDVEEDRESAMLYCTNATLVAKTPLVCNSTALLGENSTVLNCYEGELPDRMASFIPTTTTEAPEKEYSIGAIVHIMLLYAIGKSDEIQTVTTPDPPVDENTISPLDNDIPPWVPEALTLPPVTKVSQSDLNEIDDDLLLAE